MHQESHASTSARKHVTRKVAKPAKKSKRNVKNAQRIELNELLRTGMVGGPAIVFCRYHKRKKTRIRVHIYRRNGKKCKAILGYDANALYLYCSGQLMPCGKEKHVKVNAYISL